MHKKRKKILQNLLKNHSFLNRNKNGHLGNNDMENFWNSAKASCSRP